MPVVEQDSRGCDETIHLPVQAKARGQVRNSLSPDCSSNTWWVVAFSSSWYKYVLLHHPRVPERQSGGVLTIDLRWSGHLGEGGHIRSGSGIGGLRVAQTLVGFLANRP